MNWKRTFIIFLSLIITASCAYARDWQVYKKRHFIIYYDESPVDFVRSLEESAEEYYTEIAQNLGFYRYNSWTWDERAEIYIYNDDEDYVVSGKQAKWSHGVASPQDKVIRTFPTAHGFFDSTLPHELGHIIFREFVGFRVILPRWFEEGVAMYQEKARRFGSDRTVRKAIESKTFMSLTELTDFRLTANTDREIVELFYAESASVVAYMINELGQSRFVNFCRKLESTNNFKLALKSAYGRFDSIEDLGRAWENYLKK